MLEPTPTRFNGDYLLTAEIALADALGAPPPREPAFACADCGRVLMLPERGALQRVGSIVYAESDDEMLCFECACA